MNPIVCQMAAVAVAMLYCSWRRHQDWVDRKQRLLRERVAWMLWVMAQRAEDREASLDAR
jgi:hypothetical protein